MSVQAEKMTIRHCQKCIVPETRPETVFNEQGICDACVSTETKYQGIDWNKRRREFEEILSKYRSDGSWYDCIVPVSGGKNSCFQAYTMKEEFGMHPLCVNFIPCGPTETGRKNLEFLRELGFDLVQVGANRPTHRKMNRVGFFKLGDPVWPQHIGIFTVPFRVAYQYKVPLIIWGENPHFEYGGPAANRSNSVLNQHWLQEFQMSGYRLSDLVENDGVDKNDLKVLQYPTDEELAEVGVTGLFLGHYIKWDNYEQFQKMRALGFHVHPEGALEGAYNDYENLDCKFIGGLYDYLKYLKYGYGRATDQMNYEIRGGRMRREEAVKLVVELEGKIPWKHVPAYLEYLQITKEEFLENLDKFTNRKIFKCDEDGRIIKDKDGNPLRRFPVI